MRFASSFLRVSSSRLDSRATADAAYWMFACERDAGSSSAAESYFTSKTWFIYSGKGPSTY